MPPEEKRFNPVYNDTPKTQSDSRCLHCGLPNPTASDEFCCTGCEAIYKTIRGLGLDEFYRYRTIVLSGDAAKAPATPVESKFSELDLPEMLQACTLSELPDRRTVSLRLAGIHCAGCLWLLERLPTFEPGVLSSKVVFGEGKLILTYRPDSTSLSKIAQRLNTLGYPPELPSESLSQARPADADDRMLIRIGVAGFCAANTMMMAVSLFQGMYSGIDEKFGLLFRGVSALVAAPAVFYSAYPFYRSSIAGLRLRRIHVDLPISIAIIAVYLLSVLNTVTGRPDTYFDSVCTLIFLLLIGRYLQSRAIAKAQAASRSAWRLLPLTSKRKTETSTEEVPTKLLRTGDQVVVAAGERIPIDGAVSEGESSVDTSLMTGESKPLAVEPGKDVLAGSLNIERQIIVRAASNGAASRLAALLAKIEEQRGGRPQITTLTDRLSTTFVIVVLTVSLLAFAYWSRISVHQALDIMVAFLIVTCPCALGLAAPAALGAAVGRGAAAGVLIKSETAVERLANADTFFFDKTGTLTTGNLELRDTALAGVDEAEAMALIRRLAAISPKHPISRSLLSWAGNLSQTGDGGGETAIVGGRGVELREGDRIFRLGSAAWHQKLGAIVPPQAAQLLAQAEDGGDTTVLLSSNEQVIAAFALKDSVTQAANRLIADLRAAGKEVRILSGDNPAAVRTAAAALGLAAGAAEGSLLPEDKAQRVRSLGSRSVFVGDGVNDGLAMQSAGVAISLHGEIEATLEVADMVIPGGDLDRVETALDGSTRTMLSIRRALTVSAGYNLIAGTLALCGLVNPFIAAVIMPASAVSALLIVFLTPTFEARKV